MRKIFHGFLGLLIGFFVLCFAPNYATSDSTYLGSTDTTYLNSGDIDTATSTVDGQPWHSGTPTTDLPLSTFPAGAGKWEDARMLRTIVYWNDFEPVNNEYHDGIAGHSEACKAIQDIDTKYNYNNAIKYSVVIRTAVSVAPTTSSCLWAHDYSQAPLYESDPNCTINSNSETVATQIDRPPYDLVGTWNANTGFSPHYYDYVYHVLAAVHNAAPNMLHSVTIGYEPNSRANWDYRTDYTDDFLANETTSVRTYFRLFATAKLAVANFNSANNTSIKIYDGGLQGDAAFWLEVNDQCSESEFEDAANTYNYAYPYDDFDHATDGDGFNFHGIVDDENEIAGLCAMAGSKVLRPGSKWISTAFNGVTDYSGTPANIWAGTGFPVASGVNMKADGLNIHDYFNAVSFERRIDWLQARMGSETYPVVSNELGYRVPDRMVEHRRLSGNDLGLLEMPIKVTIAKTYLYDIAVWNLNSDTSSSYDPINEGSILEYDGYDHSNMYPTLDRTRDINGDGDYLDTGESEDKDNIKADTGRGFLRVLDHLNKAGNSRTRSYLNNDPTDMVKYTFVNTSSIADDETVMVVWAQTTYRTLAYDNSFISCTSGTRTVYKHSGILNSWTSGNIVFYYRNPYMIICTP